VDVMSKVILDIVVGGLYSGLALKLSRAEFFGFADSSTGYGRHVVLRRAGRTKEEVGLCCHVRLILFITLSELAQF